MFQVTAKLKKHSRSATEPVPSRRLTPWLAVCFLFPLLSIIWFAFDHSWPFWDAADHVRVEFQYADLLRHPRPWKWAWVQEFMTVNYCYPPTIHIFNGALKAALGDGRWVDSLSLILFSLIASFSTFAIAMLTLKDRLAAALSVVLINCYPVVSMLSHSKLLDFPHLAMFCLGLASLLWWRDSPGWRRAALSGVCLGLACTTKQISAFFLVVPGLLCLLEALHRRNRREIAQLLLTAAVVAAFLATWVLFNWTEIQAYMTRNAGLLGHRSIGSAFVGNFAGYLNCFTGLMGYPLLALFLLGLSVAKRQQLQVLSLAFSAAVAGIAFMSALPFQLPEHRYIVPALLFPALLSAAQLSWWMRNRQYFLSALGGSLLVLAGAQFVVSNYCPYPVAAPKWLLSAATGSGGERKGALEPSYCPTPPGDVYAQEWIIDKSTQAVGGKPCWLNMLPSTPELSVHTLELVARYKGSPIHPTTARLWTPVGDRIDLDERNWQNFEFYVLKTGAQGLQFDSRKSAGNYARLQSLVRTSGKYRLLGERLIADRSRVSLYSKIHKGESR